MTVNEHDSWPSTKGRTPPTPRSSESTKPNSRRWTRTTGRRLMICAAILLVGLAFCVARPASGQTTPSEEPDPIELELGAVTPFAGVLYTIDQAIRLSLREERCLEKARVDREFAKKKADLELATERERGVIRLDGAVKRAALIERELDAALIWYRHPLFVSSVTSLVLLIIEIGVAAMLANAGTLQVTQ